MTMRTSISDKWVRAFVGDTAVVDSRRPLLVWEPELPVPRYVFDWDDVRRDLLRPATDEPPEQPWFFLPHRPVAAWFDIVSDSRVLRHAAWTYADPDVADRVGFSWQPGLLDRWLEEDEEVAGHPRDPYKRVETIASSRHVTVSLDGVPLADSHDPVLLFETDLPTRYYVPESDVDQARLTPSSNRSHCPYKGVADRYWDVGDGPDGRNLAWSYSDPFPAVATVAGRVAFYNECVDITLDGVAVPRPVSPFSKPTQRPGSSSAGLSSASRTEPTGTLGR